MNLGRYKSEFGMESFNMNNSVFDIWSVDEMLEVYDSLVNQYGCASRGLVAGGEFYWEGEYFVFLGVLDKIKAFLKDTLTVLEENFKLMY